MENKTSYENTLYQGDVENYNISASTKDFGYFKWKINIKCFYATPEVKTPNPPNTPNDPPDKDTSPKFDYEARSVDGKDLFPDDSRGQGNAKVVGFNWTSKAKENKGTDYEIQPDKLIDNIQKQAKEGKIYSDDNLEYDVTLDRKALNYLKDKKVGAFDNGRFESTKLGIEGVKQYEVQFYRTKLVEKEFYATPGTSGRIRSGFCNNWDKGNCRKYN